MSPRLAPPPPEWVAPFVAACRDLMHAMCRLDVSPRPLPLPEGEPPFAGVSARVTFAGPDGRGALTIRFARETAARHVARFLGGGGGDFDAESCDAVAEFANMVAGRAAPALPFDVRGIGTPSVSFDAPAAARPAGGTHAALLAFDGAEGAFTAELWFDRRLPPA